MRLSDENKGHSVTYVIVALQCGIIQILDVGPSQMMQSNFSINGESLQ